MEAGLRWGEGHAGVQVPERARKAGPVSGPGTSRASGNLLRAWSGMDNSLRSDRSIPDHNAASRRPGCARAPANARLSWPVPGGGGALRLENRDSALSFPGPFRAAEALAV